MASSRALLSHVRAARSKDLGALKRRLQSMPAQRRKLVALDHYDGALRELAEHVQRDLLAEHARLCPEAADINEAIVLPERRGAYVAIGTEGQPVIVSTQPGPVTQWAESADTSCASIDQFEYERAVVQAEAELRAQYEHADIDALAVSEEKRPLKGAPIRRLLGYLIRLVLRRWERLIDG